MTTSLTEGELCRLIVEETRDAVIFADREGLIRLWNRGAEEIFGHPEAEALGRSLDLIIPERLRERHWQGYRRVLAGGPIRYGREVLAVPALHRDGGTLSIEFTVALIRDERGTPAGVAAIIRDVSARWQRERELKNRLARLEAACGRAPAAEPEQPGR